MSELIKQLDAIFRPKSIAFIGASNIPLKWGRLMMETALQSGYEGAIYPVSHKDEEVLGFQAYQSILDVPGEVDLVVSAVPSAAVLQVIAECAQKKAKAIVVITAGFAELGDKGEKLEAEAVRLAREGHIRLMGPNCQGLWSSEAKLDIVMVPQPQPGTIAYIAQSGTFTTDLAYVAAARGYGLSKLISAGNQADLTVADYLEYLGEDQDTKVIAIYMEGIKDGQRFFNIARDVSRKKPIVIYKGGRTAEGARATFSHTASLSVEDYVFDAMCKQAGVLRVYEQSHLHDVIEALSKLPLPRGKRIAVMGSGGQAVVAIDVCLSMGLEVPEFDVETTKRLMEYLPPHAPVPRNPVDFAAAARTELDEGKMLDRLANLDYIDGILTNVPLGFTASASEEARLKVMEEGASIMAAIPKKYNKPVIAFRWRGWETEALLDYLRHADIPVYETPEDCARVMSILAKYAGYRRNIEEG